MSQEAQQKLVTIITASSNSGSACLAELIEKYNEKVHIRAVFRSEDKCQHYRTKYPHVEYMTGIDAHKPDTLAPAFLGAHSALIVTPHDPTAHDYSHDAKMTENMIISAVENGVKYIVLVASWTVKNCEKMSIISSRFKSSECLLENLGKEKQIKWTVLRGGFFMQNTFYMFKDSIQKNSTINFPNISCPMVDARDIGKCAASCLVSETSIHHGKYYEINGPDRLTGSQLAHIFSDVLGREIRYNEMTQEVVRQVMPVALVQIYEYIFEEGESAIPFTEDAKDLIGKLTTFREFLFEFKNKFM
jgi:uncharacterized protein YbjT (DUF2867 family)